MITVAISQPMYFPWPGFMEMMKLADVFIWLDDAQFSKGSFTNRIQVKTASGRKWMTIPLEGKGSFTPIRDLRATGGDWRQSHRSLLQNGLANSPYRALALTLFDEATGHDTVNDVLIASCEVQARALNALPQRILCSTSMVVEGSSSQRVIDLVRAVDGTRYISGAGGARYLDHAAFEQVGLQVAYMDYNVAPWRQAFGDFTPYVTSLDLIAQRGMQAGAHLRPAVVAWQQRLAELEQFDGSSGSE
jgi:hypothetical protein